MNARNGLALAGLLLTLSIVTARPAAAQPPKTFDINPPHVATAKSIKYDYDIVYVRAPRWFEDKGNKQPARWAEFGHPFAVTPGSDLMLLHPDGSEELLVPGGGGAIQDPYVSFDGAWVYYTKFHVAGPDINPGGADVFKIHVPSRKVVQLTRQEFTTNKPGTKLPYGVYNMHPCPLPGGRVAFTSNRNGFLPPPKSYPRVALQLHVMDDDGSNVETIGHLNLAGALHPVVLKDGRIIFSSLENMGLRNGLLWAIWSIHPDGTNWAPVVSALHGTGAPSAWHFQTQLSDDRILVELYYNQNQRGFGTLFTLPPAPPPGVPAFGPGDNRDPRNAGWSFVEGKNNLFRIPFTAQGMELLTPWVMTGDRPSHPSVGDDPKSPRIGKVTHPCGAPDNHLLVAWTLGPIGGSAGAVRDFMGPRPIDSGIYLIQDGKPTRAPGEMLLIKNDPNYNEQWPRPLVSYQRLYGVDEPARLVHKSDGRASPLLPEGTPFGLVGTSSLYKRESAPLGSVPQGSVTAVAADVKSKDNLKNFTGEPWNWRGQGADAGRYLNDDIHAIRILTFEPNAHRADKGSPARFRDSTLSKYPPYYNHAVERLRILGEIPVRHFVKSPGTAVPGLSQPLDPDGNPDTSFLARIPADVAFTFQTIDRNGMVLNMAQTWHQLRPGEIRHDCGGCHAHSQQPTSFEKTAAARPEYKIFDLTQATPLVTSIAQDESRRQWDVQHETGLRYQQGPLDVEYRRDIRPIFERSCIACHSGKSGAAAAGLDLDDDATTIDGVPGTYFRLAADEKARFSPRKLENDSINKGGFVLRQLFDNDMASHYIWKFQSRRSLLVWNIYGKRLDGWKNEDIAGAEVKLGDPRRKLVRDPKGAQLRDDQRLYIGDIDHAGLVMPPPAAVAGTYRSADGKTVKVAALTDEDRRTIVRWIDLGCPIDLDAGYRSADPRTAALVGLGDDQRPTLTITHPEAGINPPLSRILIGMHDYHSGLDLKSLQITADFALDGVPAGTDLAPHFQPLPDQRWELKLRAPLSALARGTLTISVQDREGNRTRTERTFGVK